MPIAQLLKLLPHPLATDDKYSRGVVGFLTGSEKYPGAAVLGVSAAIRTGAGMVRYLGSPTPRVLVLRQHPEVVAELGKADVWVFGSGIDLDDKTENEVVLKQVLKAAQCLVIDATGLQKFDFNHSPELTLLTPHAGELATLLGQFEMAVTRTEIEAAPQAHAVLASRLTGCVVLLKGNTTWLATADGQTRAVGPNSVNLSVAGTGDVLAGILGALLALNLKRADWSATQTSMLDVAELAILIHSRAADIAAADGPVAALDVAEAVRKAVGELLT